MVHKKILGAGPSGLTAAINLAKAGYQVDVFEKGSNTGERFNGDTQLLENWAAIDILHELKNIHLELNFDCIPLRKMTTTNGILKRDSVYEKPLGYMIRRGINPGSLDQGLKAQALALGVNIHFNETLPEHEVDIVATGTIPHEIFAIAHGIVFETHAEDTAIILFNDEAAFKGYSYLLINEGNGYICTALFDCFSSTKACFERSKAIFASIIDFDIQNPQPIGGRASFSTKNVFQKENRLYVGEAAGIQDLLWGFGLRTSFLSGYIAAQSIIYGQDYTQNAKAAFDGRLKATLVSRFLMEIVRLNNYKLITKPGTAENVSLSWIYEYGKFHQLLYPVAKFFMRRQFPGLRI